MPRKTQKDDGISPIVFSGAADRDRTGTVLPPRDFKSLASACSATAASLLPYYDIQFRPLCQVFFMDTYKIKWAFFTIYFLFTSLQRLLNII